MAVKSACDSSMPSIFSPPTGDE